MRSHIVLGAFSYVVKDWVYWFVFGIVALAIVLGFAVVWFFARPRSDSER